VLRLEALLPGRFPELDTDPLRELGSSSLCGVSPLLGELGLPIDSPPSSEKPGISNVDVVAHNWLPSLEKVTTYPLLPHLLMDCSAHMESLAP
jgi:hypothetical protein